jgi:U3 small nucleolar ribonucleoprotein protein LCP5
MNHIIDLFLDDMDELLNTISSSLDSVSSTIGDGSIFSDDSIIGSSEGISLLSLKNHALLSYLHNLVLIIGARVAATEDKQVTSIVDNAVKSTIVQRVVLEKGIKGLESKLAYQIEKVLRAYSKSNEGQKTIDNGSSDVVEQESDSDDDVLNYKPNPLALNGGDANREEKPTNEKAEKYQAPKIAAVTPFTKERKTRKHRNIAMDEYINDMSVAPTAEPSIGSTIMDQGRGGERTEFDRKKQKELQNYEEENYTRLPGLSKKQEKRAARQRQRDAFGKSFMGEDWSFLGQKGGNSGSKRKQKQTSIWDRTKKRQKRG